MQGGVEAILHVVNCTVQTNQHNTSQTMMMVDFHNAFNIVDRGAIFREVQRLCPSILYLDMIVYDQLRECSKEIL